MKRDLYLHLLLAFLFSCAFICIYWVGLPTDFNSDHTTINLRGARESTYSDLALRTLDPRSPFWFYPLNRRMEYLRPLQFLWMKTYFDLFGSSLIPFHVTAAVGLGLLCSLFFFLIVRWTQSYLYAWLLILLYLSFPSNFFTLISTFSGDFQPFVSILSISCLLLFSRLTFDLKQATASFAAKFILWILTAWLAIKLKSSEKILPFVCFTFLVWRFRLIKTHIKPFKMVVLVGGIAFMMLLVIPSLPHEGKKQEARPSSFRVESGYTDKDKMTFSFHWKNMINRTFYVPGKPSPYQPQSFTENWGPTLDDDRVWGRIPYLGILVWVSFLWGLWRLFRERTARIQQEIWIVIIWFGATLVGFANGLSINDTRFLNFAYVPGILCTAALTGDLARSWFKWPIALIVLVSVIFNIRIYNKLAIHFSGMQDALVRAERDIYRFYFGRDAKGWELYETHRELEDRIVVPDWYEKADLQETVGRIQQEGYVYVYSKKTDPSNNDEPRLLPSLVQEGYTVKLWKHYNLLDASPFVFKIFKAYEKITGKVKRREFFVYKIEPAS